MSEPRFTVSDEQWAEISEISKLPPEARANVESCAGLYGHFVAVSSRSRTIESLKEVQRRALELESLLQEIVNEGPMFFAYANVRPDKPQRMMSTLNALGGHATGCRALALWTGQAMASVPPESRAPDKDPKNLDWLVEELDVILKMFTSWEISRSGNERSAEFVKLVVQLIPNHKPTGVIEAVKRIARRKRSAS